jgi:hypothetical protein
MKAKQELILCISLVAFINCAAQHRPDEIVSFSNKAVTYMGRIGMRDSCAEFYWTGSSATLKVKGTRVVSALLSDSKGNNYYYVIVDGKENACKLKPDKEKKWYTLVEGLSRGEHRIQLFKLTDTNFETTRLFGFGIDAGATVIRPDEKPAKKIEFFGNSITCGHGVDVPQDSVDRGQPEYFNNYKSYAAITARHFNAQYHCMAKSGIGITVSWFPEVMPEIYDRLNPANPGSKWDFSKYTPDIVVVDLFQNDKWLVNLPDHEQYKARFGSAKPSDEFFIDSYDRFIQTIRKKYPKATIICSLGCMDATREGSVWPGYIESAVRKLNDRNVFTHFFSYIKTQGHPKIKEQEAMAADLIDFIEKNFWKPKRISTIK